MRPSETFRVSEPPSVPPPFSAAFPPVPASRQGSTIIVTNVPYTLAAHEIHEGFLREIGGVSRAEILLNSMGHHTGRVAVAFQTPELAEDAVKRFDGGELNGNTIRVFLE